MHYGAAADEGGHALKLSRGSGRRTVMSACIFLFCESYVCTSVSVEYSYSQSESESESALALGTGAAKGEASRDMVILILTMR